MSIYIFRVHRTNLGTTRNHESKIAWDAASESLISQSLSAMASHSRTITISGTTISQLRRLLQCTSPGTRKLLVERPEAITSNHLLCLLTSTFNDLEGRQEYSLSAKQQLFKALITCISYSDPPLLGGRFYEWSNQNMPRFRRVARTPVLPLLDSIPAHVDHETVDTRSATSALESIYNSIDRACAQELALYRNLLTEQDNLLEKRRERCDDGESTFEDQAAPTTLLGRPHAEALEIFRACAEDGRPLPPTPHNLLHAIRKRYEAAYKNAKPWLLARYRLTNATLHGFFILLSLRTGWNPQSVASLTIDGIEETHDGQMLLQSYKQKTDDRTPPVAIHRDDKTAREAIALLKSHLEWGRKLQLVSQLEKRLWIGWSPKTEPRQISADGHLLRSFISRHKLAKFRLKDLRSLKVSIAFVKHRDLDQVRLILGHRSFSTVDAYLKSTIIFKLNEANILAFQRYAARELLAAKAAGPNELRTGDGGYCSDPSRARFGKVKIPCDGLSCHVGDTCDNYRIRPTKESVVHALRTLEAYRSCWQAISEQQPEKLWEVHLPRVIHIHVLLRAIHDLRPDLLPEGYMPCP